MSTAANLKSLATILLGFIPFSPLMALALSGRPDQGLILGSACAAALVAARARKGRIYSLDLAMAAWFAVMIAARA